MRLLIILGILLSSSSVFLPPGSFPRDNGETLFKLIGPSESGIKFANQLKDTREHNIMIYSNFYGGAGVALGDFNGDGLQDLFFAGNQVPDRLYFNQGDLRFKDVTRKAGIRDNGGWSSGVVLGDVNQDGHLDIYVTRELYDDQPDLRRNKLYINQGDGTFSEESEAYGVDDSERTRHATFLDYDKDGDLDLFLCNQPPNPGSYSKFKKPELIKPQYGVKLLANEQGKFIDVTSDAGLVKTGFPNSISATDLNGDGWTDLYVANDFWIEDWIFMNNGDGTFSNELYERANHISFSSMGVDAGDIDNDGDLDLMVVDMAAEDNYRSKTNMSGMNPKAFWKVVNDGGHFQYMFNSFYLNQGDGYLSDIAQMTGMATTDWSWSPLLADFDNDGWKDVFITNGLMRDIRNNDASKTFPKYLEKQLFSYLQKNPNPVGEVSIWDVVDIDKAMELIPTQRLSNYVYKNQGDLSFVKKMQEWGLDQKTFSHGAAYGDLDNDGDLDLVINNINQEAFLYENTASKSGAHFLRVQPIADPLQSPIVGAKIEIKTEVGLQVHEITTVRGMYSTSEMIAHFGLGDEESVQTVVITWPDGRVQVLENVDVDQTVQMNYGDATEVVSDAPTKESESLIQPAHGSLNIQYCHKENEYDDFARQVLIPHKMSTMGPFMAKADVNGDGLQDVFIGGPRGSSGQLFLQNEGGTFSLRNTTAFAKDKDREDMGAAFFDADGDRDLDLYVVSGGNEHADGAEAYQDRLYINDGTGEFIKGVDVLPDMKYCGSQVRPADFDRDGDIDLIVAGRHKAWSYPEPVTSKLLVNEGGTFLDKTAELAPDLVNIGMINDAQWIDYNSDGNLDLVLVGEWTSIIILTSNGNAFTRFANSDILNQQKGWWFSVEVADMDNDGDDDLVAGNMGLNYKYKASEKEPFEVYYYDFDDNGSKDVVLTYYNFGIQYPLRGRECSSQQVPMIKEAFENYDLFASSDVTEIYGKSKLENALHYDATSFASIYIENLGNGDFQVSTLPSLAQISSINDFVVHDFNQDGHKDLMIAGNLFSAEVETTRADSGYGLIMLGDSKGHFAPLPKEKSGFFAPYDVKSLLQIKCADHSLVLTGCNNDSLKVFQF
ncbi:MAG: VCBS repeat-containing protein [Saprospiraceae bacterium]|nr:VCBS repeat-containing protein [Saprospiraceae bacterium]